MIELKDLERLGPALKDLRWAARKTQADIREKTGMNTPQLSRYENGREVPTLESLVKVLNALGYDLSDLQRALHGEVAAAQPVSRAAEAPERQEPDAGLRQVHETLERFADRLRFVEERLDRAGF